MATLLAIVTMLGFAAAAPGISTTLSPTTSMTFTPLPSSVLCPVNLSSLYVDSVQAAPPPIIQPQGLNSSAYPGYNTTVWGNTTEYSNSSSSSSTPTKANAADIVVDASCTGPTASSPSTFWRESITHNGIACLLDDPDSYNVFRNVVSDYGADNSGASDASGAINNAISDGSRGGTGTTAPAYIYVPAGTYLISNSIQMLINTFLVGDPLNPPTFIADSSMGTDPIIQGFDSNYQSTTNFYTVIRNLKLDTTSINNNTVAVALNWAVSQGCQLYNVEFNMLDYSNHIGITMDAGDEGGGSGTIINDCSFNGGGIGIQMSNQQYNLKGLTFNGCNTCIYVGHIFVGTFQDLSFENCAYGVDMSNSYNIGAVSLIDSSVTSCIAGVKVAVTGNGEGSLVIDNYSVSGATGVVDDSSNTLLSGGVDEGETWVMGNENPQNYQSGTTYQINRPSALVSNGKYLTQAMPQYEDYDVDQFINVKSVDGYTVYGDNTNDDTDALNAIISAYAGCKILFFPQGIYKVTGTIYIPSGAILVGEVYSVISGIGSNFYNPTSPQPIVMIGASGGEVGSAQITDMLFSVADVLQGATILQINMAGTSPGDVALWNTHIRVGGTADTIVNDNCAGTDTADCKAAFAMLHITSTGGAYIENMWGWTADHSLDGGPNQNIATGRGALIEGTQATWLVGTAFEHNTLYQYNFYNAENIYVGMQQVETPYWQGDGSAENAPSPWTALTAYGDPDFSICTTLGQTSNAQCYMAWGMMVTSSSNVVIHGSALWVFFNDMVDGSYSNAGCGGVCQLNLVQIEDASSLFWYNLETKSTTNMVIDNGAVTAAQVNNPGGWEGSTPGVIAAYLRDSGISSEQ